MAANDELMTDTPEFEVSDESGAGVSDQALEGGREPVDERSVEEGREFNETQPLEDVRSIADTQPIEDIHLLAEVQPSEDAPTLAGSQSLATTSSDQSAIIDPDAEALKALKKLEEQRKRDRRKRTIIIIVACVIALALIGAFAASQVVGSSEASRLLALVRENVEPEKATYEAEKWLIDRLKIPEGEQDGALSITTMKVIIDRLNNVMRAIQMLVVLVSSIALLVGGIGIMEIMLTNVAERNREIGLRKALGASKRDITIQFLLESVCLTLGGGVIGTVFGFLLSFGLAAAAGTIISLGEGMTITPTIGVDTILLVVGICVSIGVVFGFYPAYRAGNLDPVEPLRYQ